MLKYKHNKEKKPRTAQLIRSGKEPKADLESKHTLTKENNND